MDYLTADTGAPSLGLYQLSIKDAGLLVAADRYYEGDIESKELDAAIEKMDENGENPYAQCWLSPLWMRLLAKYSQDYSASLMLYIEKRFISASYEIRDLSGELDPHNSYIYIDQIEKWAEITNVGFGGEIFRDYLDTEHAITWRLEEEILIQRKIDPIAGKQNVDIEALSHEELLQEYKRMLVLLGSTRRDTITEEEESEGPSNELSPRRENSYLSIVLALIKMLEDAGAIDGSLPYKAGNQIEAKLRELGLKAHPRHQTIGGILKVATEKIR